MKILLASPFFSQHWDAGHFWARALSNLGHSIVLWDYRLQPTRPEADFDVALVLKGNASVAQELWQRHPYNAKLLCYWPDAFGRATHDEQALRLYDRVYTMVRPTPEGVEWLPTGWDVDIHIAQQRQNIWDTVFIGTHTEHKYRYIEAIQPTIVAGNGWPSPGHVSKHSVQPAVYLHDYVAVLSNARISINVHRDAGIGLNRRFFESMACTFTLTDLVPGVTEVLGPDLAARVGFNTPEEAREKVEYFLGHPEERKELWQAEWKAIQPYTYEAVARRMLEKL